MNASDGHDWDLLNSAIVSLYDEPAHPGFELAKVAEYLATKVGIRVLLKGRLLQSRGSSGLKRSARMLASSRIVDPSRRAPNEPTRGELEYEERQLTLGYVTPGIIYDGLAVQRLMLEYLDENQRWREHVHVVFTSRLLATYDHLDSRYHLRTIVCGYPSVVSLSGLVEAPARKPAFYLARRQYLQIGLAPAIDEPYADDHLAYGDLRTTDVAVGYAMQALSYAILGYPFCQDPGCRLYDAHRQIEMLKAQLEPPEYCETHMPFLAEHRRAKQKGEPHEHSLQ